MQLPEIREKYPEYDNMPDEELTQRLHKRYYADVMDFEDFAGRIGYKIPVPEVPPPEESLLSKAFNTAKDIAKTTVDFYAPEAHAEPVHPEGQESEQKSFLPDWVKKPAEGFIEPTAKAIPRVAGAVGGSLALLPGAGVAGVLETLPRISEKEGKASAPFIPDWVERDMEPGSLKKAGEVFEQVMNVPGKLLKTPEDVKAVENISLAAKPFEMAGEGWGLIGEQIEKGLKNLGFEHTYIEPLLATMGEAAAMFAAPEFVKKIKNTTTFRKMTIPQRGLAVQSLAETVAKNPKMTEGQILRKFNNPQWQKEALKVRSKVETGNPVNAPNPLKPKNVKAEEVFPEVEKVKPADITEQPKTPPQTPKAPPEATHPETPVKGMPKGEVVESEYAAERFTNEIEEIADGFLTDVKYGGEAAQQGMFGTSPLKIAIEDMGNAFDRLKKNPDIPEVDIQNFQKQLKSLERKMRKGAIKTAKTPEPSVSAKRAEYLKGQRDYTEYIAALTDGQRKTVRDLIEVAPDDAVGQLSKVKERLKSGKSKPPTKAAKPKDAPQKPWEKRYDELTEQYTQSASVEPEPHKPSGLSVESNYFNTDPKSFDGYAWRTMSEKEMKSLLSGKKTYGGTTAKKGQFLAPTPESSAQYKKKGKFLVEFAGVARAEGETVSNVLDKGNITAIRMYDGEKWVDQNIEDLTPLPSPRKPSTKGANIRTVGGMILEMGGVNFGHMQGEAKSMPDVVKKLIRKKGTQYDLIEKSLKETGVMTPSEDILTLFRDPAFLKRRPPEMELSDVPESEYTEAERQMQEANEWEPEEPPPGKYVQMNAEDLPEGRKLTLIDRKSERGWDVYEVIEKDPFSITLKDGVEVELRPFDKVEVKKSDLGKPPKEQELFEPEKPSLFDKPEKPQPKPKKKRKKKGTSNLEQQNLFGMNQKDLPGSTPSGKAEKLAAKKPVEDIEKGGFHESERGSVNIDFKKKRRRRSDYVFTDPKVEARFKASKGAKGPTFRQRTKDAATSVKNKLTREYEHLPKNRPNSQLRFDLKRLEKQKGVAADKSLRRIGDITKDLDAASYDLFSRSIILSDLAETIKLNPESKLPFGLDAVSLKVEKKAVDLHLSQNGPTRKAISQRQTAWKDLKSDYIKAMDDIGFNVADKLNKESYFRHQVLEYVNAKGLAGSGKKLRSPTSRGYLKKRGGSELDINTDYIEAEYDVMAQMLYDIEVAKTIKNVKDNYDIKPKLSEKAKKYNKKLKDGQPRKTWKDFVPDGYTTWQPREGNTFFMTDSIPAKLAEEITASVTGKMVAPDVVKKVLSLGGKRKEYIVKEEIAATLDGLTTQKSTNPIAKVHKAIINKWKQWQLISPRRVFKYNARNITGDADAVFAGSPSVFKESKAAAQELYNVYYKDGVMKGDTLDWFERGGMSSTLQAQEMGEIGELTMFKHLLDRHKKIKITDIPDKAWRKYWKTARLATDFRESVLRLAAYKRAKQLMEKSKDGLPPDYWASMPEEIKGLKGIKDRAFWMSNDLLGAYDRISIVGQALRAHLFPFWSWKEVNFKRYNRMMRNAASSENLTKTIGRRAAGKALKSPFIAMRIGKFLIKASAFWGMIQVWNHTRFPEEEKELPDNIRNRPHVILGRNEDGTIDYFSRIGAVPDLLEWFGLDAAPQYIDDWFSGQRSLKNIAKEMAKSPVNVVLQGAEPFMKIGAEILTRRALFPDVFEPRTIRDRGLHIARSVGLDSEYRAMKDLPSKGYGKSLQGLFAYEIDPLSAGYSDTMDRKRRFMRNIGKYGEGFFISPTGNALYNARSALRYDDQKAAVKYMAEYLNLKGADTPEKVEKEIKNIETSLNRMHPLSGMSIKDQLAFAKTLDQDGKDDLVKAIEYYVQIRYVNLIPKDSPK